ncbi:hypothetical protein JHK85_058246 [Glycine max]|nr:hypothetical protein JHK85_058246 [Glycine max]
MDLDGDDNDNDNDIFRDDEDDPQAQLSLLENESSKEYVVYLVDASPKMFSTTCPAEEDDQNGETHFHIAISCISQTLESQIINRSYDQVAICFFNTREKNNLQDLNSVFVFNVPEREFLDRPTARLIKEFYQLEGKFWGFRWLWLVFVCSQSSLESFSKIIGSQHGIVSGTRENSLYNAIWAAQALLRKGSAKTVDKRILLFTNDDDPFGSIKGAVKSDMTRMTLQRAKDAQDLGISIELLPLSHPDEVFNVSQFYADLIGLEGDDLVDFMPSAGKKQWSTGLMVQIERTFICVDTGALVEEPTKRFLPYKNQNIIFSMKQLSEIKRVSTGHLHLLGFKPLSCLRDYYNLKPSTFLYPSDEGTDSSMCMFIALHRSMIQLNRFAVAFSGSSSRPQLVALIAQEEVIQSGGQIEPPGMHMIYLPYSDDIRFVEERYSDTSGMVNIASDDQIKKAANLIKRIDLKDFSVCQISNPALQRHYAVLQALALEEDDIPEMKDESLPDEEGLARPGVVRALEEFKTSVYGDNYDEENEPGTEKPTEASKKRKANAEFATKECENYDWGDLADTGKLKDLTVVELKYYLTAHNLPVSGKKEAIISRILTHMAK